MTRGDEVTHGITGFMLSFHAYTLTQRRVLSHLPHGPRGEGGSLELRESGSRRRVGGGGKWPKGAMAIAR
jgi:hypothetical protein